MATKFYAHTMGDHLEDWELLEAHLEETALRASMFAGSIGATEWGRLLGTWHDLGKYSDAFQAMLLQSNGFDTHLEQLSGKPNHSSAGAHHAVGKFVGEHAFSGRLLAYCIAGHHAGLADWDSGSSDSALKRRLAKLEQETISAFEHVPADLLQHAPLDFPPLKPADTDDEKAFQIAMFTRMMFSCLVDADFLATEKFMDCLRAEDRPSDSPTIAKLHQSLLAYLKKLSRDADPDLDINQHRQAIQQACLAAAVGECGFYSLTVPTGGGKTLASMAFALEHVVKHDLNRVIYAIPYTSIIEQNADVFRRAFTELGDMAVLEHHSNLDPKKETPTNRLASENWDASLVVTTNVQFFESLLANRTSRCRKLHRIAKSVIVLDEAQMFPVEFLKPCLATLKELVRNYGCTVVLCTATQPAILHRPDFSIGIENVHEIIDHPAQLYQQLNRVIPKHIGQLDDEQLAEQLRQHEQVLCIVNTKKHARQLYELLNATPEESQDSIFHLSTFMCPAHRSQVIQCIKQRLENHLPCQVISTQLIEAGVDIDFPVVYRAMAGLDSIAQAAGRCNREGRLDTGQLYIFDTDQIPKSLTTNRDKAREVAGLYDDMLGLDALTHYFKLVYWQQQSQWDKKGIMTCFKLSGGLPLFNFKTAAKDFCLIEDNTIAIIIPWGGEGKQFEEKLRQHDHKGQPIYPDRTTRRALQRYTVSLYQNQFDQIKGDLELRHDQFYVLNNSVRYKEDIGLALNEPEVMRPETQIC